MAQNDRMNEKVKIDTKLVWIGGFVGERGAKRCLLPTSLPMRTHTHILYQIRDRCLASGFGHAMWVRLPSGSAGV